MLTLGIEISKISLNRTAGALPPACPQLIVRHFFLYMSSFNMSHILQHGGLYIQSWDS